MTVEQIETFLMITQTKSLSAAAQNLCISQSAVSHRVRNLEEKLGCELLIRARGEKFVSLTLKGEEFIEIATRWKALWNETKLWTKQESKVNLTLASVDSLNTCVFSGLYKDLINSDNVISLNVSSHWTKTVYDLIERYEADIGFTMSSLKSPNAIAKLLFKSRGVVISSISSKYPAEVHPHALKTSDEILFSYIPDYDVWHNSWWGNDQNEHSSVDTVSLLFTMFDLTEKWAIVPIWIARIFEKQHSVKISELSVPAPEYACYLVSNRYPKSSKIKTIETFSIALGAYMKTESFLNSIK
ncbi:LysR family transcriptional regulator [Paraglaciecola marina]|uniref:LysR family transcriptional regulator n=1 Tax=Paraglaciecola marina TaxID=2500157 RepID=UPI00105D6F13|nr:LysR family transcriptional regulator [Paraglaciecola marina]